MALRIFGVDFSSSPSRRKPIMVAQAKLSWRDGPAVAGACLRLEGFETLDTLEAFSAWLQRPGPWVGGFDFPFSLPADFLKDVAWPPFEARPDAGPLWKRHVQHVAGLTRAELVASFRAYCNARPAGAKFAHRPCDGPAGASPSMKWVNPPVAFMMHAGATRLAQAGVTVPGLSGDEPLPSLAVSRHDDEAKGEGPSMRIALEAYPGYLARLVLARRSYKSDDRRKQDGARLQARIELLDALAGRSLREIGLQGAHEPVLMLECDGAAQARCRDDASGDALDAWLCAVQATVGVLRQQADPASQFGMAPIDPLEGWIVSVPRPA